MVSSICRAEDINKCPYHGAVNRMYEAQRDGRMNDYFEARVQVEAYEMRGWDESTDIRPEAQALFGEAEPQPKKKSPVVAGWRSMSNSDAADAVIGDRLPVTVHDYFDVYKRLKAAEKAGLRGDASELVIERMQRRDAAKFNTARTVLDSEFPTNFDNEILNGKVVDTLEVVDEDGYGMIFTRSGTTEIKAPYAMRFQANRPITEDEVGKLSQLIGYEYRRSVRGEAMGTPVQDTPYSFWIPADTTKSSSDDLGQALDNFEGALPSTIQEGSPVRTTDRKGPGTKGTRLVDGLGDDSLKLEIYYYE